MLNRLGSSLAATAFATAVAFLVASPTQAALNVASGFQIEKWVDNSTVLEGSGLAVDSTGRYGSSVYFGDSASGIIYRIDGQDVLTPFATMPNPARYEIAFDTSGDFGNQMYVIAQNNTGTYDIHAVTPSGDVSLFYKGGTLTSGIEFGTGGAFGTDMYVIDRASGGLLRIAPNGTATLLGVGITAKDRDDDLVISEGGAFGNFIYTTRVTGTDLIQRTSSTGVVTDWSFSLGGKSIDFGQGIFGEYLYLGGPQSLSGYDGAVLLRYDASANMEVFVSGLPRTNDNPVRGLAITPDELWLYNTNDGVYRVTLANSQPAVPEPNMGLLLFAGMGTLGIFACCRRQRVSNASR